MVAARSDGDWTLANVTVAGNGGAGVDAADATGNWTVAATSTVAGNDVGVAATGTTGRWAIHRTNVTGNRVGVDATGADPAGNARRTWWGQANGPTADQCVGNVTCANPLGEPAGPGATGVAVAAYDVSHPFAGVDVYLYEQTRETTAEVYDRTGRETTGGAFLDRADRAATAGPAGVVRFTGLDPGRYCVLVVPPGTAAANVEGECLAVREGTVTDRGYSMGDDSYLGNLDDEMAGIRSGSQARITENIRQAALIYDETGDVLDREAVLNRWDLFGLIDLAMGPDAVGFAEFTLANAADAEENRLKEEYEDWAFSARRGGRDGRLEAYAETLNRTEWMREFTLEDSPDEARQRYEELPQIRASRSGINETHRAFARLQNGTATDRAMDEGTPPPGFDHAAVETVLRTQERAIDEQGLADGLVVAPTGEVYTYESSQGPARPYWRAHESWENAQDDQQLASFVSFVGGLLTTLAERVRNPLGVVVGIGVQAVGTAGETIGRVDEEQAEVAVVDNHAKTQVLTLHDAENLARINGAILDWLEGQYETPTVGEVDGEIVEGPSFPTDANGVQAVDANRPRCEVDAHGTACPTQMVHVGTTTLKATNTGNATATSRFVLVGRYQTNHGSGAGGASGMATTAPAPDEPPMEIAPGETAVRRDARFVLQDTEREPFRVHTLHAALVMEGKQVDVETDWTYVDIDPGTGLCTNYPCPADEDGRYGYDPRLLPDGQTSTASDGSTGAAGTDRVRTADVAYTTADAPDGRAMSTAAFDASEPSVGTLVETELGPGRDSTTRTVETSNRTASVTVSMVAPAAVDATLRVRDASGRLVGRDPATGRDVVEVPNASYTGSDATVESITVREAANLTLTVNATANVYRRDDAVPVEVTVVETPERPAIMGTFPSAVAAELAPGESTSERIEVAEVGGQQPIEGASATVGRLHNGNGTRLPADAVSTSGRLPATIGGENASSIGVSVDVPGGFDVPDDEPTRFAGTLNVSSTSAGSLAAPVSVLVLDTRVANATLTGAGANVTGVHLDRAALDAVDGTLPSGGSAEVAYRTHVQGNGSASIYLGNESLAGGTGVVAYARPASVAPSNATWTRLHVTNGTDGTTVTVPPGDRVVALATANPFDAPVPGTGASALPTDPDGDGRYEDVDGDGTVGFLDVVSLLFAEYGTVNADPATRAALDVDGSGKVDFLDVVTLLFEL